MPERKQKTAANKNPLDSDSHILQLYLQEISKIKMLSREEETALAQKAKEGDQKARETLVCANLRFVVTVSRRYRAHGLSLMDLIHEGNTGLIRAVDRFDPEMGFHLISFAVWSIRQAIIQAIQKSSYLVQLPKYRADQVHQLLRTKETLEEGGSAASLSLLAKILHLDIKKVKHLLEISRNTLSLDDFSTADKKSVMIESIADKKSYTPEKILEQAEIKHQLNQSLLKLTDQEQEVLKMRFGLGRASFSLKKIGQIIGLSRERIRQIEAAAIRKMRNTKEAQQLFSYLRD